MVGVGGGGRPVVCNANISAKLACQVSVGDNMTIAVFLKIKCNKCPVLLLSVERIRSGNEAEMKDSFCFHFSFFYILIIIYFI